MEKPDNTKITKEEWEQYVKHFSIDKWPGDPLMMTFYHMVQLEHIRKKIGLPFIPTAGYATSGHSKDSTHYQGGASDHVIPGYKKHPLDLAIEILKTDCLDEVGIYLGWKFKGKYVVGVHFGNRGLDDIIDSSKNKHDIRTWLGVKISEDQQIYMALSHENTEKYLKLYNYLDSVLKIQKSI